MKDFLTIGEVSKITTLPISTLRYYDNEGIISPIYKDEDTKYRYYGFFQIPIIKVIVHLKKLGFSNAKIKSHLDNLSYSHTLELMTKMIEQTRKEIQRLKEIELELEENSKQMKYFITLENSMNKFFIEEEEIRGIYSQIVTERDYKGISKAFKEIDDFLNIYDKTLVPIGLYAFTITQKEIENRVNSPYRLLLLKDYKTYEKRCYYPRKKYACTVCQSKFIGLKENIEKVVDWICKNRYEIDGDTIIQILSGPAFEKDPTALKYIVRVPIK